MTHLVLPSMKKLAKLSLMSGTKMFHSNKRKTFSICWFRGTTLTSTRARISVKPFFQQLNNSVVKETLLAGDIIDALLFKMTYVNTTDLWKCLVKSWSTFAWYKIMNTPTSTFTTPSKSYVTKLERQKWNIKLRNISK